MTLDNCDRLRRSLYGKKNLMRRVMKNNLDINKRVETINTGFKTLGNMVAMET